MKNILFSVVTSAVAILFADPLNFPSYGQKVTAVYATAAEAEAASARMTGLPDDAKLAFCCRWDDSTAAHAAKGRMMTDAGFRGTFFLNDNKTFFTQTAPGLLADGHAFGNHTTHHPFMMEITANKAFREILENRINIERLTGFTVNSYAAPFGWGATIDTERRPLVARMLVETGHFVSLDNPVPGANVPETLWYPTMRMHMDDRKPSEKTFRDQLAVCLQRVEKNPAVPCITFGIHSWCDEAGNALQGRLLKSVRNKEDWFFGTANAYGAYRYSFLNGDIRKLPQKGTSAVFSVLRYSPAQLGDTVPLSLMISGTPKSVTCGGRALVRTAHGTWTLPHDAGRTLPAVIDCSGPDGASEKFPGVTLTIAPDPADAAITVTLANASGTALDGVYGVVWLPPEWQIGRLVFKAPTLASGTTLVKTFSAGTPVDRPDYREGDAFYAVGVDFTRAGSAGRLYAKQVVTKPAVTGGKTPRDTALVAGPFDRSKFDAERIRAASVPGTELKDFGPMINEKWARRTDPDRTATTACAYMPYGPLVDKAYMKAIRPIVEAKKGVRLIAFEFESAENGPVKFYCGAPLWTRPRLFLNGSEIRLTKTIQTIPARIGRNRVILQADMIQCRTPDSVLTAVCRDGLNTPLDCFSCTSVH